MKRLGKISLILIALILVSSCFFGCEHVHNYQLDSIIVENELMPREGVFKCKCGDVINKSIEFKDINLPILEINGDISKMTKENKVTVSVIYTDKKTSFESDATLKWQGATSLTYPKKNYNIQFLKKGSSDKNKVLLNDDWGKQSKYCLKANYVDFSHSRNIVSGQLYNEIVKSRDINDEISKVPNGGAVDGYPIIIFINGSYQGLYTLNIPKDKWMFDMDDHEEGEEPVIKHALIMADQWGGTNLSAPITNDYASFGFELEHCSTEDTIGDEWVVDSFNDMIYFVINNNGYAFRNGITQYVNLERTIDSMIFSWFIQGYDNLAKNILWTTYDGVHWYSSMYDMDGTWGMYWSGKSYSSPENPFLDAFSRNKLWSKIYDNFKTEFKDRYLELRKSVLSYKNIEKRFSEFTSKIPKIMFNTEVQKWPDLPSKDTSNLDQILSFTKERIIALDTVINTI